MEKKMILSGKIKPGISKSANINEIINKINRLKIDKIEKEILLLASMILLSPIKKNDELIYQLKKFQKQGEIYPDFSSSKYISRIISEVKKIEKQDLQIKIDELIVYIKDNNVNL